LIDIKGLVEFSLVLSFFSVESDRLCWIHAASICGSAPTTPMEIDGADELVTLWRSIYRFRIWLSELGAGSGNPSMASGVAK
jgi:hypothetical protein